MDTSKEKKSVGIGKAALIVFLFIAVPFVCVTAVGIANNKRVPDRALNLIQGPTLDVMQSKGHESINQSCQHQADMLYYRIQSGDQKADKELNDLRRTCEARHNTLAELSPPPPSTTVPPPQPVPMAAPPASAPPSLAAANGREPVRQFQVLDPVRNSYQLDAREIWVALPGTIAKPGTITITTDPARKTCAHINAPCAGPEGVYGMTGNDAQSNYYPTPNAHYYALLGKWGDSGEVFEIGSYYSQPIPQYAYGRQLYVVANVPGTARDLSGNTGGHKIASITIK